MTSVPIDDHPGGHAPRLPRVRARLRKPPRERAEIKLSRLAVVYLTLVGAAAAGASGTAVGFGSGDGPWRTFAVFAVALALAQLFVVRTPRNQSYQTTIVFLIPAALLLPPQLVALLPIVQ